MVATKAPAQLQWHRDAGDTLVIISASNRFCVQPFAKAFAVDDYLCSVPEVVDNRYTGAFVPPACFAGEKITHLNAWLAENEYSLEGSYFYSDSRNDIPLLERVDNPVAVNADAHLTQVATERGWRQLNLR